MSDNTIVVPWPPLPLAEPGWRQRLGCLASRAEALVGRRCEPQDAAALAVEWLGLCWPAVSPELIAGSCRASLVLGENVVVAPLPSDQLMEVHERLDEIWRAARDNPAAAVVEVRPPLLNAAPERAAKVRRPRKPPEPAAPEPADDPDELPASWLVEPDPAPAPAPAGPLRPPKQLRDRAVRMARKPAPEPEPEPEAEALDVVVEPEVPVVPEALVLPAPAPDPAPPVVPDGFASAVELAAEVGAKPTAVGVWAMRNLPPADIHRGAGRRVWFKRAAVVGRYAPRPQRPTSELQVTEPPPGWFSTGDCCELLEIESSSVGRWRKAGRFGPEGEGWVNCGKAFHYSPAAIEAAMAVSAAPGLDALLAEIQAA